jgi:hypothetical protein
MQSAQRMVKARVQRSRVYIMRQSYLPDAPQALKIGVIDNVEQQTIGYRYETVHGVVEDFPLCMYCIHFYWQRCEFGRVFSVKKWNRYLRIYNYSYFKHPGYGIPQRNQPIAQSIFYSNSTHWVLSKYTLLMQSLPTYIYEQNKNTLGGR